MGIFYIQGAYKYLPQIRYIRIPLILKVYTNKWHIQSAYEDVPQQAVYDSLPHKRVHARYISVPPAYKLPMTTTCLHGPGYRYSLFQVTYPRVTIHSFLLCRVFLAKVLRDHVYVGN